MAENYKIDQALQGYFESALNFNPNPYGTKPAYNIDNEIKKIRTVVEEL